MLLILKDYQKTYNFSAKYEMNGLFYYTRQSILVIASRKPISE